ncbi:MAG: hypothetical protein ACOYJO_01250 [Eubacterium sp.]|jgi:hypothetical protein
MSSKMNIDDKRKRRWFGRAVIPRKFRSRRGSYILEASIILPIFIASMIALITVIPFIASCENIVYAACDELKAEDIRAHFVKSRYICHAAIVYRANSENPRIGICAADDFDYLYSEDGMDDLIKIGLTAGSGKMQMMPSTARLVFSADIRSRAFTGTVRDDEPRGDDFNDDEDSETVYIFPQRGTHYHKKECRFLNPACEMTYLTAGTRLRFAPCGICDSESMKDGDIVFCFYGSGKAYHRGTCSVVDKYYVKTEKKDAEEKGYMPCSSCFG